MSSTNAIIIIERRIQKDEILFFKHMRTTYRHLYTKGYLACMNKHGLTVFSTRNNNCISVKQSRISISRFRMLSHSLNQKRAFSILRVDVKIQILYFKHTGK